MSTLFYTSREEALSWFALETRELPMPDGTTRHHTDCRMTWRSYDFIIGQGLFTGPQLVGLVVMTTEEQGGAFDSAFANVLAYVHDEYLKSMARSDEQPIDGPT